jgi:YidC/Oxa1 family membrane protein insertase
MMKLWSQNGVSPLGGCLPMLVQLPVFFALYNVMYSSVELYDTSFFYLKDLTAADPTGVIPTVYTLLMVLQQRMMPMGNMDPAQQQIMKLMPLFFAFVMYSFPSGLVLYFCVNMLLTILQQWWIRRRLSAAPATT